jgi:predicted GNAT family acetyltransferase
MRLELYKSTEAFAADTLEVLLENEVQNNLPISFIDSKKEDKSDWLLGSVKNANGGIALVAACTPPFNVVLYETGNRQNDAAVRLLSDELNRAGFIPPGVTAERGLARRFAEIFCENRRFHRHISMNIMRLDAVKDIQKALGRCRPLREDDLYYTPYWARAFAEECRVEEYDIPAYVERHRSIIEANTYYIWEDGCPVSQAAQGRKTQNGAVLTAVYTPPHYRSRRYASSVVAELSQILLDRGNKFCCLFADAENPISCGIYRKIGYRDLCVFEEIRFEDKA